METFYYFTDKNGIAEFLQYGCLATAVLHSMNIMMQTCRTKPWHFASGLSIKI
jgi:hypothetical protein